MREESPKALKRHFVKKWQISVILIITKDAENVSIYQLVVIPYKYSMRLVHINYNNMNLYDFGDASGGGFGAS